jgi:hypothetical protein
LRRRLAGHGREPVRISVLTSTRKPAVGMTEALSPEARHLLRVGGGEPDHESRSADSPLPTPDSLSPLIPVPFG